MNTLRIKLKWAVTVVSQKIHIKTNSINDVKTTLDTLPQQNKCDSWMKVDSF